MAKLADKAFQIGVAANGGVRGKYLVAAASQHAAEQLLAREAGLPVKSRFSLERMARQDDIERMQLPPGGVIKLA